MSEHTKGVLIMVCSAVFFSIGGLFIKMIPWSPFAINGVRCMVGALVFGIYMLRQKKKITFNRPTILGAVCVAGTAALYNTAMKFTTAGNASILEYTSPIFILLFSYLFFRKKPQKADIIVVIAVFFGIFWFFLDGLSTGHLFGNAIALCSGMTAAAVYVLKLHPKMDIAAAIFLGLLLNGIIFMPTVALETVFTPEIWFYAIILGIFQLGVAYILFFQGLSRCNPIPAVLAGTLEPILNPVWTGIFYGEMLTPLAIPGVIIVLISVVSYNIYLARQENIS